MSNTINIFMMDVGKQAVTKTINNDLQTMQNEVNGYLDR